MIMVATIIEGHMVMGMMGMIMLCQVRKVEGNKIPNAHPLFLTLQVMDKVMEDYTRLHDSMYEPV